MANAAMTCSPAGSTFSGTAARPAGAGTVTCESDGICPMSGLWEIVDLVTTTAVLKAGSVGDGEGGVKRVI